MPSLDGAIRRSSDFSAAATIDAALLSFCTNAP
jgi:hypothetical protein